MDERASRLDQLRIDRPAEERGRRRGPWIITVAVLVLALALGGVWWWRAGSEDTQAVVGAETETAAAPIVASAALDGSTLDASGYIVARRQATVSAKTTARVVAVPIEEGQWVAAGQVLARIDDANARAMVAQLQAELMQAQARIEAERLALANAEPIHQRDRMLHAQGIISRQAFDVSTAAHDAARMSVVLAEGAEAVARAVLAVAEQSLDDTVIRAPFAGVVTVRAAQAGDMVSPVSAGGGFTRTGICTIVDMDSLELDVEVNESFINRVHASQKATVVLNAYPDWRIPAAVIAVIPTADRAKATVRVRIGLGEKDRRILPEMGARVSFLGGASMTAAPAPPDNGRRSVSPASAPASRRLVAEEHMVALQHGR